MVANITDQGELAVGADFPGPFSVGLCKIHLPFTVNGNAGTRMSESRVRDGECHQRRDDDGCFCFHGCDFDAPCAATHLLSRARMRASTSSRELPASGSFSYVANRASSNAFSVSVNGSLVSSHSSLSISV